MVQILLMSVLSEEVIEAHVLYNSSIAISFPATKEVKEKYFRFYRNQNGLTYWIEQFSQHVFVQLGHGAAIA